MWLGILCMCVRSEHARPRVPVCACTWTHVSRPRYSSGLYVRTYAHVCTTYRSLVRAFVCVYTRPSPSCIRVSGSVSSSRVAFRASISAFPPRFSLIFCKNLSLRFHVLKIFLFFAAKVNPHGDCHTGFFSFARWFFYPSTHPLTLPLLLYLSLFFFSFVPIHFLLLSLSLSLSLSLFYFSPVVCFRLLVCVLDESICLENTWPWVVETIRLERMDRNAIPLPRNFPATTGKCPERASLMD